MKISALVAAIMLWSHSAAPAYAFSTSADLTILDVRTYETGLVVRVAQPINASCAYPDHLMLFKGHVDNYDASVSLFMTGWSTGKIIRAYYEGCGATNASSGADNVYVSGWLVR